MSEYKRFFTPRLLIAGIAITGLASQTAVAEPSFARLYQAEYGYTPSCNACHQGEGGSRLNLYGEAFKKYKMDRAAFNAIGALDADGDGFANGVEALKKANPGDAKSYPGMLGNWLDVNALIPMQVQALYPDVKAYKPIDTILTDKEIARAAAIGITLSKADENIIYLPLKEKRPLGTVIIVPAEFEGKRFHLLVATDRKLNITHVQPLNSDKIPEVATSTAYAKLVGKSAQAITIAENIAAEPTLDDAIRLAAKRGATLIHVRLKKK